uniref:Bcl-2 Bcl-2 homology region 1-3 domain-containing protein n=1 Tax=Nothobranchius furzeri TaxID=105023 RepID=A0A8C6M8B0_NOTFU
MNTRNDTEVLHTEKDVEEIIRAMLETTGDRFNDAAVSVRTFIKHRRNVSPSSFSHCLSSGMHVSGPTITANMIADVARKMCSDGHINWGRVVCLVAFGSVLAHTLEVATSLDYASDIGNFYLAMFISFHIDITNFLLQEGFLDKFGCTRRSLWSPCIFTLLGATLITLSLVRCIQ